MDLILSSKGKVSKQGYVVTQHTLDLHKIYKRPSLLDEWDKYQSYNVFDRNVYLFVDKRYVWNEELPFNINLKYRPIYIGKGYFDSQKDEDSRALNHHNDLLARYLSVSPDRYECLLFGGGMTENEASCLEAYLIWYLVTQKNYSLSRQDRIGDLINKRRERKWESHITQFLNVDNQWKLPSTLL